MRWQQFQEQQPDLARAGARLLAERHGYSYLATLTRHGGPRIHPVAPILTDAGLFLAVLARSPKFADLTREPRLALHACVSPPDDEEFALRGNGIIIDSAQQRQAVADQARDGAKLTDAMHLLEIDLVEAIWTQWSSDGPIHQRWSELNNDH